MRVNSIKTIVFALILVLGLVFIGDSVSSTNASNSAYGQEASVRRVSSNVAGKTYRGGHYVYRKTWNGTKWVYRKTWYPTKRFGQAAWHGTKAFGRSFKRTVY